MPDQLRPMLPDPPKKTNMQGNMYFVGSGVLTSIALHYRSFPFNLASTTLVSGGGYICPTRADWLGSPYPNLTIAFDVDAKAIVGANGYVISEVGKPPDFVMEIGYDDTFLPKYSDKKAHYQRFGIPEYWRYDHTGGQYYGVGLEGCRLAPDGAYRPIELHTEPDGVIWGYSEALQLSLCWVPAAAPLHGGWLRFWKPPAGRYLLTPGEEAELAAAERDARLDAEARYKADHDARLAAKVRYNAAESQVNAERDARLAAEARIRELEAELRRRENT